MYVHAEVYDDTFGHLNQKGKGSKKGITAHAKIMKNIFVDEECAGSHGSMMSYFGGIGETVTFVGSLLLFVQAHSHVHSFASEL